MNLGDHGELTTRNAPDQHLRDLTVRALQIRAGSIDEAQRSIEMILATEGTAQVFDMRSYQTVDEILRMDGCELPAQMPLLADHNRFSIEAVRGSIRNLRVEGSNLIGRAFFADDEDSLRAWNKVKQGHLTDVSAGYRVTAAVDIPAGMTQEIAGRSYTAGQRSLRVSTKWTPREGSLVPIGADPAAKFREDPIPTTNRATAPDQDRPMFKQWLKARGLDHDSLTDAQRSALKSDFDADQARVAAATAADAARASGAPAPAPAAAPAPAPAAAPAVIGAEAERAAGIRLERERVMAIRAAAAGTSVPADVVLRAESEGWDLNRANAEFLNHLRSSRPAPAGGDRDDRGESGERRNGEPDVAVVIANEDKFVRAATTALMLRSGAAIADRDGLTAVQLRAEATALRGIGLQDLARLSLRAHRQEVPIAAEILFKRAVSSYSFPTALGNTLYRTLLNAYETAPSTILQWAASLDVNDFRTHKAVKMGKFARPEKVGKAGNFTHGTLNEEAESYSADTFAQAFVITRQDFINDDMGLFTRVPMELGASMKMNIDDVGYDLLISAAGVGPTMATDSVALFNASRTDGSNYLTGATGVLSSAGLTNLKQLFRKLKQNGRQLNLMPVVLLVPPELEQTALELVKSTNIVLAGTTDVVRGSTNIHSGTLQVIVEPRLSAATNGTTAWYLICDPIRAKSLAVSFLKGQSAPAVERRDPTDALAMGWLAYHDVGVSAVDWRGIIRAKGA